MLLRKSSFAFGWNPGQSSPTCKPAEADHRLLSTRVYIGKIDRTCIDLLGIPTGQASHEYPDCLCRPLAAESIEMAGVDFLGVLVA